MPGRNTTLLLLQRAPGRGGVVRIATVVDGGIVEGIARAVVVVVVLDPPGGAIVVSTDGVGSL
ncbi:MAG: hypothetical protein ABSF89_18665 [Acidimicrobiales bacterium]|jgi:hypothetical protein